MVCKRRSNRTRGNPLGSWDDGAVLVHEIYQIVECLLQRTILNRSYNLLNAL